MHRCDPREFELSGLEAQFARHSLHYEGGQRVFLGLTLEGCTASVLKTGLPRALLYAQVAHPILQCVLASSPPKLVHSPTMRVSVEQCTDDSWESVFQRRSKRAFALGQLPLSVFYCPKRGASDVVDIVFQMEHFACDGACGPELVHHIVGWMTGVLDPPVSPCVMPLSLEDAVEASCLVLYGTVRTRVRTALAFGEIIASAFSYESETLRVKDLQQRDADMGKVNSTLFDVHRFDEAFTQRFIAKCKEMGASVTAVITAAYLEAHAACIQEYCNKDEFQLSAATVASVRKACVPPTSDEVCSPHLGLCNIFFTGRVFGQAHTRDSVMKRIAAMAVANAQQLREQTTQDRLLFSAKTMAWRLSNQPISRNTPTMVVSSWSPKGPIQAQYDGVKVSACLFAMNAALNAWSTLGIFTIAGKLHVHFMLPVPRYYKEDFDIVHTMGGKLLRELAA